MSGKTLDINEIIRPDHLGRQIAEYQCEWQVFRNQKIEEWKEIQQYVFATDTTSTTNSQLSWSNKTTLPKLCQIRDNLYSNYMATLFPKQKWFVWEGHTDDDESVEKKQTIEAYMEWVTDRPRFRKEVGKMVLDYIDYGNCFSMPEWIDERNTVEDELRSQSGYVGPILRRISPLDIVFNPIAPDFESSPKIITSLISLGEVKEILERESNTEEEREMAEELLTYLQDIRGQVGSHDGAVQTKDDLFDSSGFGDFRSYLQSNYVEVLTFYGDIYDQDTGEFLRNQMIQVVDRHKVITKKTNPSLLGKSTISHVGWRIRPDNLWAMGPLDNLVGMQYRIDHLENMKADVFDLIAYPPLKIKGVVPDFDWGPMERIYVDSDGDVDLMSPDTQALNADTQIAILENKMEEFAGSPREAMGIRSPGEKTKFEFQQLQNASSRVFQNKTSQFEQNGLEPGMNAMLELARRNMTSETIRIFDDELKIAIFQDLTAQDLTGNGRLRPVAARHFAEQAQMIQNLNGFFNSAIGQDQNISQHFSSIKLAKLMENLLELERWNIVQPYIRLSEQADAQRQSNVHEEEVAMEAGTPIGIQPDDFDEDLA